MFRDAFESRRRLIPADGFYEWKGNRVLKLPYRIERPDRSPYAYAGLCKTWTPDEGEPRVTCTILTTEANDIVEPIHDQMPVILEKQHEELWLSSGSMDEFQSVLKPYPSEELHAYPVSKQVNTSRNESEDCLRRLTSESSLGWVTSRGKEDGVSESLERVEAPDATLGFRDKDLCR